MKNDKSNKGLIIGLLIVIGLLIITLVVVISISIYNNKDDDDDYRPKTKENVNDEKNDVMDDLLLGKENNIKKTEKIEKTRKQVLEKIGKYWYEYLYYSKLEDKYFVSKFSEIGIKITLETIVKLNDYENILSKKELDSFHEILNSCDKAETKIIIYPKGDFNKNDYDIDTKLVCNN